MKKIIISAAVAAMGVFGAVAGTCDKGSECPFAYKLKVVMKTTGARKAGSGEAASCERGRKTRRLVGFVYGENQLGTQLKQGTCQEISVCGCNAWDDAKLVLWDAETGAKYAVSEANISILNRIGSAADSVVEISFVIDGITFAGQGRAVQRNGSWILKHVSGFCAGVMVAGQCVNCRECGDVIESNGWSMCGGEEITGATAAYGKWALGWSEAACQKLRDGKPLEVKGGGWDDGEPIDFAL